MERNSALSMLDKASLILSAFTVQADTLTLTEISKRSGLSMSTVHRLVGEMRRLGWIGRAGRHYALGLTLFELGELVPIKYRLRALALPFMQDLLEITKETVHLGVRSGLDVVYIEKIHRHGPLGLPSRTGGRAPLTCTAIGKALLMHEDPTVIDEVLESPLRRLTPRSITDAHSLRESLMASRETGIATEIEEASLGGCCVSAPVLVGTLPVAAISISSPKERFKPQLFSPALRAAAFGLGRRLGLRYHVAERQDSV